MRGLPGSGKSTQASIMAVNHMAGGGRSVAICSTDSYFLNEDGKYIFDPSKLGLYHGRNQYQAHQHMFMKTELIIIDNTNTTHKEMKPYKDSAEQFGYEVEEEWVDEIELLDPEALPSYIDICAKRNTHGVPKEAIERMAKRFQA